MFSEFTLVDHVAAFIGFGLISFIVLIFLALSLAIIDDVTDRFF